MNEGSITDDSDSRVTATDISIVIDLDDGDLEPARALSARSDAGNAPPSTAVDATLPTPSAMPQVATLSPLAARTKRALDLTLGALVFVVSLPIQLLIAAAIAIESRGPVLFRQVRVGQGGRPFRFYKFRTMHADAATRFRDLYRYEYTAEELEHLFFKYGDDPRCTRVGRFIRRTSLDELPNLINVVRGEMSLVGPRPEIPQMVPYYRPDQMAKFAVKPGVTGLAQISGRNILRFQETTALDLEYVCSRSLGTDLRILARTPVVVVRMLGAL